MFSKLALWFNTVRYLRLIQIYRRLFFNLYKPSVNYYSPPLTRFVSGAWIEPVKRKDSMIWPDRFLFLNEEKVLTFPQGWDDPYHNKLWRYNLHYFDDLNAENASCRINWHKNILLEWVRDNSDFKGTGWEPYPTSLRIVNWIKWTLIGNKLPEICIQSLAIQTRWLSKRMEYHLLGNHLFANAKALLFSGLFFEGSEAKKWYTTGLNILNREIDEQILSDGGHFERSPMYHAIILEDIMDLVNLFSAYSCEIPPTWISVITKMRIWLIAMCHPDQEIAFFNDAAIGISSSSKAIEDYSLRLNFESIPNKSITQIINLKESGYVRVLAGNIAVITDIAPIGPDYLPAHAHADTLSFELSIGEHRVFVNSGTSEYREGKERLRQRGTMAHNTLSIDGLDSSEVWASFRVARRARITNSGLNIESDKNIKIWGEHDGYAHISGSPKHKRTWTINPHQILIVDEVFGTGSHRVEIYFHIHPACLVRQLDEYKFMITDANNNPYCSLSFGVKGRLEIKSSSYHPKFGLAINNYCIKYEWVGYLPLKQEARIETMHPINA